MSVPTSTKLGTVLKLAGHQDDLAIERQEAGLQGALCKWRVLARGQGWKAACLTWETCLANCLHCCFCLPLILPQLPLGTQCPFLPSPHLLLFNTRGNALLVSFSFSDKLVTIKQMKHTGAVHSFDMLGTGAVFKWIQLWISTALEIIMSE